MGFADVVVAVPGLSAVADGVVGIVVLIGEGACDLVPDELAVRAVLIQVRNRFTPCPFLVQSRHPGQAVMHSRLAVDKSTLVRYL